MNFSQWFSKSYQHLLGEDAAALRPLRSKKQYRPFRTNRWRRNSKKHLMIRFNTPWGRMERSQENPSSTQLGRVWLLRASSSDSGPVAQPKPGMEVLDLAAAPGEKTTQLLSYLDNQDLSLDTLMRSKTNRNYVWNLWMIWLHMKIFSFLNDLPVNLQKVSRLWSVVLERLFWEDEHITTRSMDITVCQLPQGCRSR